MKNLLSTSISWATSKTLPEGIWKIANVSHEQGVLDYTDAYVDESGELNVSLALSGVSYESKPDKAESNHIHDIFVGFKYKLNKSSAFAYTMTAKFLKTRVDATEKKLADGIQELEASKGYDDYHFYFFKDSSIEKYKDENATFSHLDPTNTLRSGHSNWTKAPNSRGFSLIGSIELCYQSTIFLNTCLKSTCIMKNNINGQIYDFPRRLQLGKMVMTGITLFAK